jgi:hypothetical protein
MSQFVAFDDRAIRNEKPDVFVAQPHPLLVQAERPLRDPPGWASEGWAEPSTHNDILSPARGIALGLVLSAPIWVIAYFAFF